MDLGNLQIGFEHISSPTGTQVVALRTSNPVGNWRAASKGAAVTQEEKTSISLGPAAV